MTEHQVTHTQWKLGIKPKFYNKHFLIPRFVYLGGRFSNCSEMFIVNNNIFYVRFKPSLSSKEKTKRWPTCWPKLMYPRQGYDNGVKRKTVKIETNDSLQLQNIHTIEWKRCRRRRITEKSTQLIMCIKCLN